MKSEQMVIEECRTDDAHQQEGIAVDRKHRGSRKPIWDDAIDTDEDYDLSNFQVVRREFFSHLLEPSVVFNNCKFSVNTACLAKFPEVDYIHVMVNKETKVLALKPCQSGDRDAFNWCALSKGKRRPRQISCKMFFAMVTDLMGWNPNYKYKLLGGIVRANGEAMLTFDLTSPEVYERTFVEGEKPKTSRKPVFPIGWKGQFGLFYEEHQQAMQVQLFNGYAVYSITGNPVSVTEGQIDTDQSGG